MKSSLKCVDVVLGMQFGDEGKGKIVHHLCKSGKYNLVLRGSGGSNAGHTIYHKGIKHITHLVPAGVFFGIRSVIGPGCVVNLSKLFMECTTLADAGINVWSLLKIDKRAHVITAAHIADDAADCEVNGIGTTKQGIGPAYRDKCSRSGVQIGTLVDNYNKEVVDNPFDSTNFIPHFAHMLTDTFDELHTATEQICALYEGAQGHGLDIDWGDYPYVTSSHTTLAGAMLNGIPHTAIRHVYGVAKAYETYVGAKKFHNVNVIAERLQATGCEYGATTGRLRQVDFFHMPRLIRACTINGVTDLIINKCDIFEEVMNDKAEFLYYDSSGMLLKAHAMEAWKHELTAAIVQNTCVKNVLFSYSPYEI